MDLALFKTKLAVTAKHLADADHEAHAATAAPPVGALRELRHAASGIDELIRLCNGEASAAVRACPTCAKTVMAAARLCGYCWTKLTPAAP